MKKKNFLITSISLFLLLLLIAVYLVYVRKVVLDRPRTESAGTKKSVYCCPMHPDFTSDKPGSCAICGMNLVKKESKDAKPKTGEKKILFYRNPMDSNVTSSVPMKDSMGMDYIPVYAVSGGQEEEGTSSVSGIYMSPEKQQLIGVTKEKVEKKNLISQIFTVGRVAYDPDLYVAQEEYLQALRTLNATKESALGSVTEQSKSLLSAAEKKLFLLGMSKEQIDELAKRGTSEENLYLPIASDSVWVYITIYEYEIGLIKEGLPVEINSIAFPGEIFQGKINGITPVLNPETRSLQVRAEIKNPGYKLKPGMFVDAKIKVDLGEKLAVPETAVLDTGLRKIVYLVKEGDMLESREVTLGQKAQGYFEVLDGLKEGDVVVTSGNFLVDSESKLKAH